jgi:hypothetical protein
MNKYEDKKISFSYPDDIQLTRAKQKWGQYGLEKKIGKKISTLILIDLVSEETYHTIKRMIRECPFDENAVGEIFESVSVGGMKGIGHVVTLYDNNNEFYEKIYRYIFPTSEGGINIEISSYQQFTIDLYMEILESIKVKEESSQA